MDPTTFDTFLKDFPIVKVRLATQIERGAIRVKAKLKMTKCLIFIAAWWKRGK